MTTYHVNRTPFQVLPKSIASTAAEIAAEPWVVEASVDLTQSVAGPLTTRILSELYKLMPDKDYYRLRCDVRVQHFRPGDAVPRTQWHCDYMQEVDGVRTPDSVRDPRARHWMLITGEPRTEFMVPALTYMPMPFTKSFAKCLAELVVEDKARVQIPASHLVLFDAEAVHRGTVYKGTENTTRYFFRASLFPAGDQYDGQFTNQVSVKR